MSVVNPPAVLESVSRRSPRTRRRLLVGAMVVLLLAGAGGWLTWPGDSPGAARLPSTDGLPTSLVAGASYESDVAVAIPRHWFPTRNHTVLVTAYVTQNGRRQVVGRTMIGVDSGSFPARLLFPPLAPGAATVTVTVGDFDRTSLVPQGSLIGTGQVVRATATYHHVVVAATGVPTSARGS